MSTEGTELPPIDSPHPSRKNSEDSSPLRAGVVPHVKQTPTAEEEGGADVAQPSAPTEQDNPKPKPKGDVWGIDFSLPKTKRKATKKERTALMEAQSRRELRESSKSPAPRSGASALEQKDSEGNETAVGGSGLNVVSVDDMVDYSQLVPKNLTTTRADLEKRLCLRLPRLLCVNKQYPRSCGVSSFTSIYNYLYSWIGESEVGAGRPPLSQEEVMTILGFEPPFGEIAWGGFTGNATLMRWFHALNRNQGLKGRAYILYKAHGAGKTTHLYENKEQVLATVKKVLADPHCALIYHCHNHYMVPIGYQDIPKAQTDFLKPNVTEENCETTIFIGEVSRGRHEAMYARKWSEIVKDIESLSPEFYNIRKPELGIQTRVAGGKKKGKGGGSHTAPPGEPTAELKEGESNPTEHSTDEVAVDATSNKGEQPHPATTGLGPKGGKKKKERGNLHCLICFRNDEEEPNPGRFENMSEETDENEEIE